MRRFETGRPVFRGKNAIDAKWLAHAFEVSKAKILKFKGCRCKSLRRFRHKQSVGCGERLQPRRNVRRLADRLHPASRATALADHDSTGANAHPRSQRNCARNVGDFRENCQSSMHCTDGIVLMRARPTEKRH